MVPRRPRSIVLRRPDVASRLEPPSPGHGSDTRIEDSSTGMVFRLCPRIDVVSSCSAGQPVVQHVCWANTSGEARCSAARAEKPRIRCRGQWTKGTCSRARHSHLSHLLSTATLHGRRLAHIGQISNMCGTGVCTFINTWTGSSSIPDHTHLWILGFGSINIQVNGTRVPALISARTHFPHCSLSL